MSDRVHVLVTVSRTYTDWEMAAEVLGKVFAQYPGAVLVHGDARRGDRDVERIWVGLGGEAVRCPADWEHCADHCKPGHRKTGTGGRGYCPTAGHRRNAAMVDGAPDLCLAFIHNNSRGATATAALAERAGIPTVRYNQETNHG